MTDEEIDLLIKLYNKAASVLLQGLCTIMDILRRREGPRFLRFSNGAEWSEFDGELPNIVNPYLLKCGPPLITKYALGSPKEQQPSEKGR